MNPINFLGWNNIKWRTRRQKLALGWSWPFNNSNNSMTKSMPVIKAQIGLHDWLRVHSYFFWCKKKWWKDDEDRCNSAKVLLNTQTGWIQLSGSKSKIFKNEAWFCDCQPQIFNLLVKILESDSETKILLYIGKWANFQFREDLKTFL